MRWRARRTVLETAELDAVIDANVALSVDLEAPVRARLTQLTGDLVDHIQWEAVGGMSLTTEVIVTIAANAAIPILGLDRWIYRNVRAVIVRPTVATLAGARGGPAAGTMTDDPILTSGVAMANSGPLAISWDVAVAESRAPSLGRNLVIHEFAHKIDMSDGYADGTPPLRGPALARWTKMLASEYEQPDREMVDPVLDPYAWDSPAEFFAVATEAFFCVPGRLAVARPALYGALREAYNQDPANDRGRT